MYTVTQIMLNTILFNIPFAVFFLYAIKTSREHQKTAAQPATLAFYVFAGLLAELVVSLMVIHILGPSSWGQNNLKHIFQFFSTVHLLLDITLLICVFAWRGTPEANYKRPAIFTAIAVCLKIILFLIHLYIKGLLQNSDYQGDIKSLFLFSGVINAVLEFTAYVLVFKAIFDARGYPRTGPDPFAAALGIPSGSDASTPVTAASVAAAETTGMFEERDFIPYGCGVMVLGGLLVVPVMWGGFMELDYAQALFPSLLSCGVFVFSHDKRGTFLWGRFVLMVLFIMMTVMRAIAQNGGSGRPMFMAGGVLGYFVMFGCGWAGIAVARLVRGKLTED